ncbi:MAG: hypothetical protein R3E18_04185 [Sphingomonadaceae bacterium]|nr:hypothetical protein [Sphingomonadaceae bacterium]
MRLIPVALIATLALAGCKEAADTAAGDAAETDQVAVAETPAEAAKPEDQASPESVPEPAAAEGTIPARYLGVWDYVKGSCARESDMRMDIKPGDITFYESTGDVTSITAEGEDVLVELAMEGEGEKWVETLRLVLSEDGQGLDVTDGQKPKVADEYPRKKCPQ